MAERDQQLSDLIVSLQQFVTGLAERPRRDLRLAADHRHAGHATTDFLARPAPRWPPTSQALGRPLRQPGRRTATGRGLPAARPDQDRPDHPDRDQRQLVQLLHVQLERRPSRSPRPACPATSRRPASGRPTIEQRRGGVQLMARESKPFRDRNPVIIGAISLRVIAAAGVPRLQRAEPAAHRRRHRLPGAVLRGGRPPARRPGARRRREGRQGREPARSRTAPSLVEFRVNDAFVGDRTEAAIKIETVLGAKYLALVPRGAGELDPDEPIPLERTASPYDVVEAFADLSSTVEDIDTAQLASSFEVLAETFADTPDEVRTSLQGLARLSDTIASRDAQLGQLLSATRQVTQVLADRNGEFTTADRRLEHAAHRGAGAARADRLHPHQHPGAVRAAVGPGRRQPRGAHPGAAAAVHASPTSCPATGRRWRRR